MKVGAAALAGGIFGVVGTLCFFLAFSTDYWLVASDNCGPTEILKVKTDENGTEIIEREAVVRTSLTLHHEGFFWRCVFQVEPSADAHFSTLFTNQPQSKECMKGYLFPFPVAHGPVPHPIYDATAVFRGFWTVLIILGLLSALIGGFLLVCGVPFLSHKLYKVGGALLITAACLFLFTLLLYVMWIELVDVRRYILQESGESCPEAKVSVLYGLSFMVAAAGIPLVLVSGIIFVFVARALSGGK